MRTNYKEEVIMAHPTNENLIYLYGVIPAAELETGIPQIVGIDQKRAAIITFKELAAVITPVNAQFYSQQNINLQLKDAEWLKQKAFHHHECISTIHNQFTIFPMTFCTIFQHEDNLIKFLNEQYDELLDKLTVLNNKQEWNIKIYCSTEKSISYVVNHNPAVVNLRENLSEMPKGKQFIMKKKLDQLITSELEKEQSKWWYEIENHIKPYINEARLRRNWGKEITERNDEMIINCDYLIEKKNAEQFLKEIPILEQQYQASGCSFQLSGPWPPYHFSKKEKVI